MTMDYFIEGDLQRLFLNTRIGCKCGCTYCYLSELKFENLYNRTILPEVIIEHLENSIEFKKGKNGTIFSIGCYSDCWDPINRESTISLLNHLLKWGNPIQMATKFRVSFSDLKQISSQIQWVNQLSVYLSCPVLSNSKRYEPYAEDTTERLKTIISCRNLNIPAILYIKPVLKGITISDLKKYINIINDTKIPVVVGESFSAAGNNGIASVGNGILFRNKMITDQDYIIKTLRIHTQVFYNSTEIVEFYRES